MATATKKTSRPKAAYRGPQPGFHEGIPFAEYLSWPYLDNTLLLNARRSMAHFRAAELATERSTTTAKSLGEFVHVALLEPDEIEARYVVLPPFENDVRRDDGRRYDNPKATKAYKAKVDEFLARHAGKQVVSQSDFDAMLAIRESLRFHERARRYLDNAHPSEVSLVWDDPETGIRCKARVDKLDLPGQSFTDVKTTRDAAEFPRFLAMFGYHQQMAFYADALAILTGQTFEPRIVAIETSEPYLLRAAPVAESALDAGREQYRRLLDRVAECRRTGCWDGYADPDAWTLPEWQSPRSEPVTLDIGGELLTL